MLGYGEETSSDIQTSPDGDFTVKHLEAVGSATRFSMIWNVLRSFFEPLYDRALAKRYFEFAKKLMQVHDYDAVVAMYFPLEPIEIAYRLKKTFPKLHFASYELDSATNGIASGGRLAVIQRRVHVRWLKRIYKKIDSAFVMASHTSHAKELYGDLLGERLLSTDLPVLIEKKAPEVILTHKTHFLYAGILDKAYRSPKVLLDLFQTNPDAKQWRMHFFSKGDCEGELQKASEQDDRIVCHGYVPSDVLDKAIDEAEVLVSIGNANSNSVPSKIINYISFGKPILHFSLQNEDVCCRYFEKYPLALVIPFGTDSKEATEKIKAFVTAKKGERMAFTELKRIFYQNSPDYSVDLLEEEWRKRKERS